MHYREEILKFQSVTHIMLCSRNCAKPLTNINTFNPPNNQRRKVLLALPYIFRHRATGKLYNPFPSHYQYRHSVPEHCFLNSYPQFSRTSNAIQPSHATSQPEVTAIGLHIVYMLVQLWKLFHNAFRNRHNTDRRNVSLGFSFFYFQHSEKKHFFKKPFQNNL